MNAYRYCLPAFLVLSTLSGFTAVSQAAGAYDELRGKTQSSVESLYGEPNFTAGPVGDPPITRWIYDEFTVVFEYDHVVHAFEREPELEKLPSADRPEPGSDNGDVLTLPE